MIGWVDAGSGASGDMLLGALVGAGVPVEVLQRAVSAVSPEPVTLSVEEVHRGGFAATRCTPLTTDSGIHRTWREVRDLLDRAPEESRERSVSAFTRLAEAEAAVHGVDPDEVHFHEVGALDAIADVVGVCAGLVHLGLDRLVASPVAVGGGHVETEHGRLSVPPPAVACLLQGVPSYGGPVELELCTPTGAALLTEWADNFGPQPAMATNRIGVGAGGRDPIGHANVLRLLVGPPVDSAAPTTSAVVLEANIDDLDPRLWPPTLQALLDAGASDAWLTPILMKKGRPAHTLSVLVPPRGVDAVRNAIYRHTTTIGMRVVPVGKHSLERVITTVHVSGQPIRVKQASLDGEVLNSQPEYEDVIAAAHSLGVAAKQVMADAIAASRPT